MNIFSFAKTLCTSFFYSSSSHQTQYKACYVAPAKSFSKPVEMKASYCYTEQQGKFVKPSHGKQSFNTKNFKAKVVSHPTPTPSPVFYSHSAPQTSHGASKKTGAAPASHKSQKDEALLSKSLQNQIRQMETENQGILAKISMKRSERNSSKSIQFLSTLESKENVKKHAELSKLNTRLQNISDFCNEEMIEVLSLVTDGCTNLEKKLATLRKECASMEDEALLCETIEHIDFLEKIDAALHQLEAKFQSMQKSSFDKAQIKVPAQDKEEVHISSLLDKIERLNEEKQFLEDCKQKLPARKAYDVEELKGLMQLFENERKDLSQKTKETRQKHNLAKQFGNELTNHLIDYSELFKDYVQKLKPKATPAVRVPLKPVITPLISKNFTLMPFTILHSKLAATPEKEHDTDGLKLAALELTKAVKELMEITTE